jgi:class 3 adenylate cyclase
VRVPRTFVFVDLGGFTNYTAGHGDDAAGRILSTFRSMLRDVASRRGVRIAKWLGDGCMMVGMDQADAIAAMLDLEAMAGTALAPLTLRVGVATGHALLFEGDDYIGSAVNLAARLCDAAGPFEVLIPADQLEKAPDGVTVTPHGLMTLRGFPAPFEVVELSGHVGPAERHDTGELWTRPRYVV